MLTGLSEAQARLLFLGLVGLVGLRGRRRDLDDRLFGEALGALVKTVETREKGILYEHQTGDARAQVLVHDLAGIFEAEDEAGRRSAPADHDLAVVLRALRAGLAGSTPDTPTAFVDAVVRIVGRQRGGSPPPAAGPLIAEP
jgi:hypothetical protein